MEDSPKTCVPHTSAYIPVNLNKLDKTPKNTPQNFESAKVEYTKAVIKYKGWIFQIRPVDASSMENEFEIEVKNELFSRDFYLVRPAYSFEYQKFPHTHMVNDIERFTSLEDAKDYVKDFINNKLQ